MTTEHPITLPPELVVQWCNGCVFEPHTIEYEQHIATQAARWGADRELEACCEWLMPRIGPWCAGLRAARRPKPPSLKEQALERCNDYIDPDGIIRRALEQLDD